MQMMIDSLRKISEMKRANKWLYDTISPFIGNIIMDAGSGNGNLLDFINNKGLIIAIDKDDTLISDVERKDYLNKSLKIFKCDLTTNDMHYFKKYNVDTILCINVLEHIENDEKVLSNFNSILCKNGNLIVLVPAIRFLHCSLDNEAGHFRRYSKTEIVEKLKNNGFQINKIKYFNLFGTFGWFITGKVLKNRYLSSRLLSLFDSLVPLFRTVEKLLNHPFGLSLIVICKKY